MIEFDYNKVEEFIDHNWYDGPLDGRMIYDGKNYWFEINDFKNFTYNVYELTEEQWKPHLLFEQKRKEFNSIVEEKEILSNFEERRKIWDEVMKDVDCLFPVPTKDYVLVGVLK